MFSRVAQIARHLSKPATHLATTGPRFTVGKMATSTAEQNFARTIATAACLIIGDEVLGGKTKDVSRVIRRVQHIKQTGTVTDYLLD